MYRHPNAEYQIAFTLPSGAERILGVALSRSDRDFTAAERDLLNVARPYLIQTYRNALAHTAVTREASTGIALADLRALGLTQRQAQVLRLVAMGHSNQHAADALGIAEAPPRSTSSTASGSSTSPPVPESLTYRLGDGDPTDPPVTLRRPRRSGSELDAALSGKHEHRAASAVELVAHLAGDDHVTLRRTGL